MFFSLSTLNISLHQQIYGQRRCGVYIYIHSGVLLSHKKCSNDICNNMDGPRDYYTKWSQRKTNIIWYHIYGILKNNTNELIYKTETFIDIEKKLVVTKGDRWKGEEG